MRRLWRTALGAVTPYEAGRPLEELEREFAGGPVIRLSANENPLGPSPRVVDALRQEAARAHLYPDGGSSAVRRALGDWLGVAPDWLILGNGADELVGLIARAAFEPDDEVIVPDPSFEPYATETLLAGAALAQSPLAGYDTDLGDMGRRVTARTKAIFICTPHNPAGTLVRRAPLARFLTSLGADPPLVILDEAYRDFCDDPETPDGAALAREHPTLIALRTFSKIAGLAGLRIGYAIARPETIERLNRVRAPYNVNRLAQAAALAALADRAHLAATRAAILAERPRLAAALLKSGILVRDGAAVGFPGHLRITIGTREQNDRLLAAWDGALSG